MNSLQTFAHRVSSPHSIQRLLVIVAISQILGAVGLVGYLSFKNGQKAVAELGEELISATNYRVQQELDEFLSTPHQINHLNIDAVETGLLTLGDPQMLEYRLWNQLQAFESVSYIYISSVQGGSVAVGQADTGQHFIEYTDNYPQSGTYLIFNADDNGNLLDQAQKIPNQTATDKLWFKKPIKAQRAVWTEPFHYTARESVIAISASSPLYDGYGTLKGVTTVDIGLKRLSDFLQKLTDSPEEQIFIVDRGGQLLAASEENPTVISRGRANIIKATESPNYLIRESVQAIEDRFGALSQLQEHRTKLQLNDETYFAQVNPWRDSVGLDWLVVVLVPEAKFMGQIQANNKVTILLCLLSAMVASALATWIARSLSTPILKLSEASGALAEASRNNFADGVQQIPLKTSGIKEFKTLALSFSQMSEQLQASHIELESYSQSLEQKVAVRTQDLEKEIVVRKQAEAQSLKAKEAAETASQVKSEFLANMSHELRSPLNAILGFAQLMRRDPTLSAENLDSISIVNRSGEHLLGLINDILDMSKIEAGRAIYQPTDVDLHRLLDNLHSMFHFQAAEKQLTLDFQYGPHLPPYISTDVSKLRQILINLLNNALKFTESGGIILRIQKGESKGPEADEAGDVMLNFEVEDTGCGIEPHEADRVFLPFMQTSAGEKSPEGTGLGLPISQKFAQMMGGDVSFLSLGEGQGTTVSFQIQTQVLAGMTLQVRSLKRRVIGLAEDQPTYRLLIVDDKLDNRKLLSKLLAPIGFSLKEACNGQEAVNIAARWQPHLIWMDVRMPVMDGYEAARAIKQATPDYCPIIIAISASSFKAEQNAAAASGCDDFIRKPLRTDQIFDAIAQYLSVRYRYASTDPDAEAHANDDASNVSPTGSSHEPSRIDAGRLLALPEQLLSDLESAALRLQWDQLHHVIEQISWQDAALAATLTQAIQRFHYSAILQAIQTKPALQETAL